MSTAVGYALFPTALGACGIAWSEAAIVGVRLPESDEARSRARLADRHPQACEAQPPAFVRDAMARVVRLLAGEKLDLADVTLDFGDAPDLHRRIYEVVRAIPAGKTLTYGEVARAVGQPHAAQAVGQAMGRNPCPILMPCHRVLGADGKIGGFSAPGGARTKQRLLEIEGATSVDQLPLFSGLS
jgi:methylated-DNA-[protein]-cysteine S-methyltransferase